MKKVFIFGTGKFGILLLNKLKNKYKVIGFLDNNIKENNVNGIRVFSPTEIKKMQFDEVIIGSNGYNSINQMVDQLIEMGINKSKINCRYTMKVKRLNVSQIFLLQHNKFEKETSKSFFRYNLIIQILAIENMNGINDIGIELSKKYRKIVMPNDDVDEYMKRFKTLVDSFTKEGYKSNSYISLNKKGELIDGTHRLALLMVNNIKEVDVRILNTYWQLKDERDIDWISLHNDVFSEKEICIMMEKYDEIREKILR